MTIDSPFNVVASSASVFDEADPPKSKTVGIAIIVSIFCIFSPINNIRVTCPTIIVSYRILSFVSYSFRCDASPSQHKDQECQKG